MGKRIFIDISDAEACLSIDVLAGKYCPPKHKDEPEKKGKQLTRSEFLNILERIILESKQEGEVSNAKDVYKRVTGRDFGVRT